MQFVGEVHTTETYAAWRAAQRPDLRATTPALPTAAWINKPTDERAAAH